MSVCLGCSDALPSLEGDDGSAGQGGQGEQDGGVGQAGGGGQDMGLSCTANVDCDDGLFCTGLERCQDGRCMTGAARTCDDGVECTQDRCDEDSLGCVHRGPDEDGDGFVDVGCLAAGGLPLGTDCDDGDANRFPGNVEVCDPDHHDEDCDLSTYGALDQDMDGHNDGSCCNQNAEGTSQCGDDCDDSAAGIAPTQAEVCNDIDDDCDGSLDEGLPLVVWSPDCDGDGIGDISERVVLDCATPVDTALCNLQTGDWVDVRGDCDEQDSGRNPGVPEVCNRVDDDCDGAIDEDLPLTAWLPDCDGDSFGDASATPVMECAQPLSAAMCDGLSGSWVDQPGDCDESNNGRNPGAPEVCNFSDDDCDNLIDDIMPGAVVCYAGQQRSCTNVCGEPGVESCAASCLQYDRCLAAEACNGCDDDGNGSADDGFECAQGTSDSCTTQCGTAGTRICDGACSWAQCRTNESCNYCDDDGDGSLLDERPQATNYSLTSQVDCGGDVTTFGPAACFVDSSGSGIEFYANLLDGSAANQSGAYWFDTSEFTGWGRVRVEAKVQARVVGAGSPLGGWSVIIADGASSTLSNGKSGAIGISLDWYWASETYSGPDVPPGTADAFRLRKLSGFGDGQIRGFNDQGSSIQSVGESNSDSASHLDAGDTGWVTQTMVIDYMPDDPSTFPIEESVTVSVGSNSRTYQRDEHIYTTDPNNDLDLHIPLVIGFIANSRVQNYPVGPPEGINVGTEVEARVHLHTFHPPTGPGNPTWDQHTNYSRWDHCPGL